MRKKRLEVLVPSGCALGLCPCVVGIAGSNLGWGGEGDVRHQAVRAEEKDTDSLWKLLSV